MSRTIAIIGSDIHGPEDWWSTYHPEENPWLDGGRLQFDRAHEPSMHNQYYELAVLAEVDGIAVGLRGDQDAGFEHLPLLSRVAQSFVHDFKGRPAPTWMPFIDTVGLGDLANYYRSQFAPKLPFDFANDDHLVRFWTHFLGPYFDVFSALPPTTTPDGRPLILWWGINPDNGHGIVHQSQAARLLEFIAEQMRAKGYERPAHIVDETWIKFVPRLDVHGVHGWFNPNTSAYTIRTYQGVTVGLTVPGFIDPPDARQPYRVLDRRNGDTLREALAAMRAVKANYVFIESYNNRIEGAGLYRTDARGTRELDTVREHIHLTKKNTEQGEPPMDAVTKAPLLDFVLFETLLPGDGPGKFALPWNATTGQVDPTSDVVFSLQPDETIQTRALNAVGAWESSRPVQSGDNKLVFITGQAIKVFGLIRGV